jgi:hypothetical protein
MPASPRTIAVPLVVALLVAFAFVGLYTSALHRPQPNGVPVAYAGPPAVQARLQSGLDAALPGGFELRRYTSEGAARAAVLHQDADGAFLAREPRLLVAGAAGPAGAEALQAAFGGAARAQGRQLAVSDVRPAPAGDPRGLAVFFTTVGTTVASLVFAALLLFLGGGLPARVRLGATALFAALAGVVVGLTADPLVGALGSFWATAGMTALLALAVAATAGGLGRLAGRPGLGLAVLVVLLLGASSSGGPVGYRFLPDFYTAISQGLPVGAALTGLRRAVLFDGASTLGPILVLLAWLAFGLLAEAAGRRRAAVLTA